MISPINILGDGDPLTGQSLAVTKQEFSRREVYTH